MKRTLVASVAVFALVVARCSSSDPTSGLPQAQLQVAGKAGDRSMSSVGRFSDP